MVVGDEGSDFLSHAPKREIGVVGVETVASGGVMGFDPRGAKECGSGARVSLPVRARSTWFGTGGAGRGLENAEPMSERVSARQRRRREGAIVGTWWDGEGGGRLIKAGDRFVVR
jgi:hypothetical protein